MWMFVRPADAGSSRSRGAAVWADVRQISDVLRRAIPRTYAMEHLLVAIAIVSLGFYAFVSISEMREQAALARELAHIGGTANLSPRPIGTAGQLALRARPAPRAVVGRIEIPRLKLSATARQGADVQTLRTAVGHVPETALPGDIGDAMFAGYRDTFFRKLAGVRKGDDIVVTTATGIYRYIVTGTRIVAPTETSLIGATEGQRLTLITSYPFDYIGAAPERFIVRAEAVAPTRP
jgi:sortase A